MPRAVVLRFVAFESLDGFAETFLEKGVSVRVVDAWLPQAPKLAESADILVVMGGPLGVGDIEEYPYLSDLILMLRDRIGEGLPTLGICLGAQLMAQAMGGNIGRAELPEIGIAPIHLTAEGYNSALECFADEPLAWHWHQDQCDLPPGATLLARSALTEVQAFSVGSNILGCQFHPEFAGDVESWLVGHAVELQKAQLDVAALRESVEACADELASKAATVAHAWLAGLGIISA